MRYISKCFNLNLYLAHVDFDTKNDSIIFVNIAVFCILRIFKNPKSCQFWANEITKETTFSSLKMHYMVIQMSYSAKSVTVLR